MSKGKIHPNLQSFPVIHDIWLDLINYNQRYSVEIKIYGYKFLIKVAGYVLNYLHTPIFSLGALSSETI